MAQMRLHMLRQAQRGKCYLCTFELPHIDAPCHPDEAPSRDHIRPRCNGGELGPPNVAIAHYGCNNSKSGRAPYACEIFYGEVNWLVLQSMFPDTYGEEAAKLWPIKKRIVKLWLKMGINYKTRREYETAMAEALREAGYT